MRKNQLWKLNETQLKSKPKNQNEIKITKKKKSKKMTKCKIAMTLQYITCIVLKKYFSENLTALI